MPDFINTDYLIIMAETLAAEHLLAYPLARRKGYFPRLIATVLLCMLAAAFLPVPQRSIQGYLLAAAVPVLSGLSLAVCYGEDFWSILFCTVSGYTIHHVVFTLYESMILTAQLNGWPIPAMLLYLPSVLLVYGLCFRFFTTKIRAYRKIQVDNKKLFVLTGVAVLIDISFRIVVLGTLLQYQLSNILLYLDIVVIVSCVMILAMQFLLLTNRGLEAEVQTVRRMLSEGEKQYRLSRDSVQLINLKCHDLKHQIRRFREAHACVDQAFLKEIENAVGIYDAMVQTGNEALDTILSEKSLICEKNQISLTCMADGHSLRFISPTDIYSLFGNMLDNAIEAAANIPQVERRGISLNVRTVNQFLVIHVQNYFEGAIRFVDGLPQTSKADQSLHGFGIKSIQVLVEKYHGTMSITAEGHIFSLKIMFSLAPEAA